MLNRTVLIVKAKEPFLEWLRSLPGPADHTLAEVNEEATAYLLPATETPHEQHRVLRRYYPEIFEQELAAWWTDVPDWPQHRSWRLFRNWFDVEFHTVVLDLADAPLRDED